MMSSYSLWFPGNPIPAVRTTKRMLWTPASQRYKAYKEELALAIALGSQRPLIKSPVRLSAVRFDRADKRRVDIDNLLKSLMDAMMLGELIADDSQIKRVDGVEVRHSQDNPGLYFMLQVI